MIQLTKNVVKRFVRKNWAGYCPICEADVRFWAQGDWYRDDLICGSCASVPRERALMRVLNSLYPDWRKLQIHESSPSAGGASKKLAAECSGYIASQYLPDLPPGTKNADGFIAQDLEKQTFPDQCFDLVVTQDVFEHLFHPDRAIAEIVRTLKLGGAHVMSVPIIRKAAPSTRRAEMRDAEIAFLAEPQYHGNPVGDGAALVTVDWGYDIADYLTKASGHATTMHTIDDISQGIRAEYIEIVVTRKGVGASAL